MLSQPRLKSILMTLIFQNQDTYIPMKDIANTLNVTTRTLRSDIKILNLSLANYGVKVKNKRSYGLYLSITNKAKYQKLVNQLKDSDHISLYSDDYQKRLVQFLLMILNSPCDIDNIMAEMFISDSTVDKYLKESRKLVKKYNLRIKKDDNVLKIVGNETDIRSCIIDFVDNKRSKDYIRGFSKEEKYLFQDINLNDLLNEVTQLITVLGLAIHDYNVKNIVIHLALELLRSHEHNNLFEFNRDSPQIKIEYQTTIKDFFNKISKEYKIDPTVAEYDYFLYHLALNYPQIMQEDSTFSDKENKKIHSIVISFLDKIKDNYVFNLIKDRELITNLENHLRLLVKVKGINGHRKNPLLNLIISTFPLAYEMTVTAAPVIEHQIKVKLSPDELAFITLHVGASMERLYTTRWTKKKAALVCGSGTATATILKARLSSQFSEYLNIVGVYSLYEYEHSDLKNIDFVISTVPIYNSRFPVIQVDLSNFQNDSAELYQYLVSISDKSQVLMNLFDGKLIYLIDEKKSKRQVLDLMIGDLKKYDYVKEGFKEKVYKRESMYSTAIGNGIAIPHPIKYAAIHSKVSFARLTHPIKWDDKNLIKYVFLISVNKKDYPNIQNLFTFLVDLQQNQKFRRLIDKCETIEETKDTLRTIIQEVSQDKEL